MTFSEMRQVVCDYCNLTSDEAKTRIGKAINRHYRRVTSSIGLDTTRFVTRSAVTTIGVATVTFTEIEQIDRLLDTTSTGRLLQEVSMHDIRGGTSGTSDPMRWAVQAHDASSVTVLLDTTPQVAYSLQADGRSTVTDLNKDDEPAFPESYHDILPWSVISEELLKKEKERLAAIYQDKAERLLSDLRFFLAESHTHVTQQGSTRTAPATGGAAGGAGGTGTTSYTQSGLLTFDRGAGIVPFAVARADAPYVVNLGSEFLGNITTDRLIGRDTTGTGETEQLTVGGGLEFTGSGGIQRSALAGDITASAGSSTTTLATNAVTTTKITDLAVTTAKIADGAITNVKVNASAAIAYSKLTLTASIVNADVSGSAAIAYSKLALTGSIVNADVSGSAAIAASKLNLSSIAQDVTFTDATYDIGKSGATRPRDIFPSRGVFGVLGSASAPSYAFAGDTNTGMFSSGADTLSFTTAGATALEVDSTGFVDSPTQPRCIAYHSTTQTVTAAPLVLDSEDVDVGAMHSTVSNTSRITVPTGGTGFYLIIGQSYIANTDNTSWMAVQKNGTTYLPMADYFDDSGASSVGHFMFRCMGLAQLSAGDYVELIGNSANPFGHASKQYATALSVVKLW